MFGLLKRGLGLFYSSPMRLLRFSLNNALRPFLKAEFADNFELGMWQGTVNIENVELNEQMLNKKLNGSVPFRVLSAVVGKLTMDIPWRKIATQPVKVAVSNVRLHISVGAEGPGDPEELEQSLKQSLEQSLEHSLKSSVLLQQEKEEEDEDYEEDDPNLGIESVEELFENIFSQMCVSFHNTSVYISNDEGQEICLTLEDMLFNYNADSEEEEQGLNKPPVEPVKTKTKKQASIRGLSVHILSPEKAGGQILSLLEENFVYIRYAKDKQDNFIDVEVDADFVSGVLQGDLSREQLSLLVKFFDFSKLSNPNDDAQASQEESTESEDELDMSDPLGPLQRSILSIAPYSHSKRTSEPLNFLFNLHLSHVSWIFPENNWSKYSLQIDDFFLCMNSMSTKKVLDVSFVNMYIHQEGQERFLLVKVTQDPKTKKVPFNCNIDISQKQDHQMVEVKFLMNPLLIKWGKPMSGFLQFFQGHNSDIGKEVLHTRLENIPQLIPKENAISLIKLKTPCLHLIVEFPDLPSSHSFPLDVRVHDLSVGNRPTKDADMWFLEFEKLHSFLLAGQVSRSLLNIWTKDMDDKPRMEITSRKNEAPFSKSSLPSLIIDLENVFSRSLLFSYYSKECSQIADIKPDGTIDLMRTKQNSNYIIDLVFPCLEAELYKSELQFWSLLLNEFSGGSPEPSSIIISVSNASIFLRDGKPLLKSSFIPVNEFRIEAEGFKCFNGTIKKLDQCGSFVYIAAQDIKLLDKDNAVLFRKTPRLLRLDEVFCSPFAITGQKVALSVNDSLVGLQDVTFGANFPSWSAFFGFFSTNETKPEQPPTEESHLQIELSIESSSLYFQPTDVMSATPLFVVPPKAILTVGLFKMVYTRNSYTLFLDEMNLWLKEDFHILRNHDTWVDLCHPTLNSHLSSKCFIRVAFLNRFELMHLSRQDSTTEIAIDFLKHKDNTVGRESDNPLSFSVRLDSFETMSKVSSLFLNDLSLEMARWKAPGDAKPQNKTSLKRPRRRQARALINYDGSGESQGGIHLAFKRGEIVALLETTGNWWEGETGGRRGFFPKVFVQEVSEKEAEDSQAASKPPPSPGPSLEKQSPPLKEQGKNYEKTFYSFESQQPQKHSQPVVLFDELEEFEEGFQQIEPENPAPRTRLSDDEWEWINDDIENKKREQEEEVLIFPPNIPTSTSIKLCNLFVVLKLVGGYHWESEEPVDSYDIPGFRKNTAFVGVGNSVEIKFDIPLLSVDMYTPEVQSEWRLKVEVFKFWIDDIVKRSHHAKLLTFSRPRKNKNSLAQPNILILLEQGRYDEEKPDLLSYKLKLVFLPVRLYIDQETLTFLIDFFTYTSYPRKETEPVDQTQLQFEYFEMSAIDSTIDYKPRGSLNQVYSDFRSGNHIWAFKAVELNKAHIVLSPIKLRNVMSKDDLLKELLAKNFKQNQIYNYLFGTRFGHPVQIGINIGAGFIDLVKTPIKEYKRGGNTLMGIGVGATSLVQKITVELLNLGASSAITIKKGLHGLDKVISSTEQRHEQQHISSYANQPENFTQGAKQAASSLASGFGNSVQTVSEGGMWHFPSALLQPAIGTFSALSHLTLGLRNTVDPSEWENSKEKYKEPEKVSKDPKKKQPPQ